MPRAVIDPGVLVSAAISPGGVCGQILRLVIDETITLLASPAVLVELADVLSRPKFRRYLSINEVNEFVTLVMGVADIHTDPPVGGAYTDDPDDDYLIALAQSTTADYLIASDKHLLSLANAEVSVLSPREFLETLHRTQDE